MDDPQYFEYKELIQSPEDAEKAAIELRHQWNLGYDIVRKRFTALHELAHHTLQFHANMEAKIPNEPDGMRVVITDV